MADEPKLSIREFADLSSIVLFTAPQNVGGLLELIEPTLAAQLDFEHATLVNRSHVTDNLKKWEHDITYLVPFRNEEGAALVYLLLEHQSKPDRLMGYRLFAYMADLFLQDYRGWQRQDAPASKLQLHTVIPIVFYTGDARWNYPVDLHSLMNPPGKSQRKAPVKTPDALRAFVPEFRTLFFSLRDLPQERLSGSGTALALRVLRASNISRAELDSAIRAAVEYLESASPEDRQIWKAIIHYILLIVQYKSTQEDQAGLRDRIASSIEVLGMKEAITMVHQKLDIFDRAIQEGVEKHLQESVERGIQEGRDRGIQEGIEKGIERGIQEGLEKGIERGIHEGRRDSVMHLLDLKFGPLSADVRSRIQALSIAELDAAFDAAVGAAHLSDVPL